MRAASKLFGLSAAKHQALEGEMHSRKWNKVTVTRLDGSPVATKGNVSPGLRAAVFRRDGNRCRYCGHRGPRPHFEVDHVVARRRGGPNSMRNLVVACWPCNQLKGSTTWTPGQPPWDRPDFDRQKWRRLVRTAGSLQRRAAKPPKSDSLTNVILDGWYGGPAR